MATGSTHTIPALNFAWGEHCIHSLFSTIAGCEADSFGSESWWSGITYLPPRLYHSPRCLCHSRGQEASWHHRQPHQIEVYRHIYYTTISGIIAPGYLYANSIVNDCVRVMIIYQNHSVRVIPFLYNIIYSVGIENVEDIIKDLEQALDKI